MGRLFEPARLGGLDVRNRILRSATAERRADKNGYPTEALAAFYEDLARGGAGTIITGMMPVLKDDTGVPNRLALYEDAQISPIRTLTDCVHAAGAKIAAQLVQTGANAAFQEGGIIWGPSAVEHPVYHTVPKEMTREEIHLLVTAFGAAARRAKEAGFDAVEIHGAHGYLLSAWLAPFFNRRTDEYGGSPENRARLLLEVYDAMRAAAGPDYPVWIKLNAEDFADGGSSFEDCLYVCRALDKRGIALIEISGGTPSRRHIGDGTPEGYFSEYAAKAAEELKADVVSVGGYRSTALMEKLLRETDIRGFALSRPLLCEPDLVNKWIADPTYKPRCTSCSQCFKPKPGGTACILNAPNVPAS